MLEKNYTEKLKFLIFLVPTIYFLLGFYFRQVVGDLSLRSIDPMYHYFLSALCVSTGKFGMANVDHPGSLMQYILAVTFVVIYFFRGNYYPYFEDAIINSDLYLSVGNLVVTLVIVVAMYLVGKEIFKITGNLLYAIVIQLAPMFIDIWYEIIGVIYPEQLLVIPVFILAVLLLKEIYDYPQKDINRILSYALAIGIGLSIKMTFLPFAIMPLFLIKGLGDKLKYIFSTVIVFSLFAIPVLVQFDYFFSWMTGLFVHNGNYESGEKTIIDVEVFLQNLKLIISSQKYFFYTCFALIALTAVLIFIKSKQIKKQKLLIWVTIGLLAVIGGNVFFVSKHYAVRYFVPALLCFPLIIILLKEGISCYINTKVSATVLSLIMVWFVGYRLWPEIYYMRLTSDTIQHQVQARETSRHVVESLKKEPYRIIVSEDYGSPFHEYAIMYSFCMAGKQWPNYREKIDKLYPHSYLFMTFSDLVMTWGPDFNPPNGQEIYIYLQDANPKLLDRTLKKFFEGKEYQPNKLDTLFINPINHEIIYSTTIIRKEGIKELVK